MTDIHKMKTRSKSKPDDMNGIDGIDGIDDDIDDDGNIEGLIDYDCNEPFLNPPHKGCIMQHSS